MEFQWGPMAQAGQKRGYGKLWLCYFWHIVSFCHINSGKFEKNTEKIPIILVWEVWHHNYDAKFDMWSYSITLILEKSQKILKKFLSYLFTRYDVRTDSKSRDWCQFYLLLYLHSGSDMSVMITGDNCGKDKINLHFRSPLLTARTTGGIYWVLNSDHINSHDVYCGCVD